MYEELQKIQEYLPLKVDGGDLNNFIEHHLDHLFRCVKNELYSSSLTHLHILYMVFVYLHIHRIAKNNEVAFGHSLIGFARDEKELLKDPDYPLVLSKINEKTVFRFFRLNNFDDSVIHEISKPVEVRNDCLHASGKIICESEEKFENEFNSYIDKMDKIIDGNINILTELYVELVDNELLQDPDYELTEDDIEINILIPSYFSQVELRLIAQDKDDKISKYINELHG